MSYRGLVNLPKAERQWSSAMGQGNPSRGERQDSALRGGSFRSRRIKLPSFFEKQAADADGFLG